MSRPLTAKQQKFAAVYAGNATDAARLAGYKGNDATLAVQGAETLRNPKVAAAIKTREQTETRPGVASRQQRQAFWTEVLNDRGADMGHRLKASELLGRSEADFTEKIAGADGGPVRVSITINAKEAKHG